MIDFQKYKNKGFNEWQIETLRLATKNKINDDLIEKYLCKIDYNFEQMNIVRQGLLANLDVAVFAYPEIPSKVMQSQYDYLLKQKEEAGLAQEQVDAISIEKQALDNKDHAKLHKTLMAIKLGIKLLLLIIILMFIFIIYLYLHIDLKLI